MSSGAPFDAIPTETAFRSEDIAAILRARGWLAASDVADSDMQAWLARAVQLLGPQAADRGALENLLALVFVYDAATVVQTPGNQAVLMREGARDVIRELANRLLAGGELDSERLKDIVDGMKTVLPYRSRDMFHPIRVALAGAEGTGELDRVILLLDAAAKLPFATPVKGSRERMLEFCAALD
jgi:hypothetical protein